MNHNTSGSCEIQSFPEKDRCTDDSPPPSPPESLSFVHPDDDCGMNEWDSPDEGEYCIVHGKFSRGRIFVDFPVVLTSGKIKPVN